MKKLLITVIGAAAALGASAGLISTQRFENASVNTISIAGLNTLAGGTYWSGDEQTNKYTVTTAGSIACPRQSLFGVAPSNALKIETTFGRPLNVNAVAGGDSTNINSSVFFDSLVKFTVCDSAPTQEYADAKIVMWLQETEADGQVQAKTNLMVKAGYLYVEGGVLKSRDKDYTCDLPQNFDCDAWHRVTIKAIANITKSQTPVPGFAIHIDGDDVSGTSAIVLSDDDKWDESFTQKYEFADAVRNLTRDNALFPSIDQVSGDKVALRSVGFDGTGSITDLIFTEDAPSFAEDYVPSEPVVVIDGQEYTSLAVAVQAINASATAATFKLASDLSLTAPIEFNNQTAAITLDFAGHVITNTLSDAIITNNAANLIITNSTETVGGIKCNVEKAQAIYQANTGTLAITAGNFWGDLAGDLGKITISGGAFKQESMDLEEVVLAEGKAISETKNADNLYPVVEKVNYAAQIGQQSYETFAAALAAAADGDTITLLDNVTAAPFTINVATFGDQGLTIDLGGFTYTFDGGSGDGIYLLSSNKLTIANGTLAAASGMAYRDLVRDYNSVLTLNNVTVDGTNFPATDGTKLACLICVEGGGANIIGNTSIINVKPAAYAIKMGNHAQAWYEMGTTTVNTTGNIEGNILIAGGVYNEVAVGSGSTINYYYGKNVHSSWEDGVSSANFAARLGTLAETGAQDNVSGQLFKTLQAAVDAASAGDTVTVLADCTISGTPLSIAKNLTVHNDHTITGAVNYAICIGATVSFEGSGKIERASNISGSAFCVGANETTRGAITAGTAGTLNFDGLTVCGGSGGNLIKLENGTVNMNGGVLRDGKRGIKADADVGSYTSAIVINGGTITNNTDCAVMASAASTNGTATVVVNGGVIAGALVYDGKAGTYSITIPGTSTAKFDADQSAFCAEGYKTTLSDGWYVVTAVPPPGIDPATKPSADVTAASAEAAIEAVEVTTPTEAGSTPEAKAAYKDLFTYTAVETSAGSGVYTVTMTGIKETVQETVEESAMDVLDGKSGAKVQVPAGLEYKVTTYTELGGAAVDTKSGTSDGTGVSVSKPGTTQGFIKVEMGTKSFNQQ